MNCYRIITAPVHHAVRHVVRHIARHAIRHAVVGVVSIVCVATPAWLAVPSPAVAPIGDMPPVLLPWPGVVPADWGPGGEYAPGVGDVGAGDVGRARAAAAVTPISGVAIPDQPIPEPSSAAVLGVGMLLVAWGVRR